MGLKPSGEEFSFLSGVASRLGRFRMSLSKKEGDTTKNYIVMLKKNSHNVLLRKALLRKLGYTVPPSIHLKDFKVSFEGAFSKKKKFKEEFKKFKQRLGNVTEGAKNRWIRNADDEEAVILEFQDAIAFPAETPIYDLSLGTVDKEKVVLGRRVFNALLLPYALVDIPESINLFRWNPGQIINGLLHLPYEDANEFSPSYDDALWMMKRILKLTRKDWEEIATEGAMPEPVAKLFVERVISRRNSLKDHLKLKDPNISFNPKINFGSHVKDGKLTKEDWPEYGTRWAWGDPESPLSNSEIWAFVKSKFWSNVLSNLITRANDDIMPHSDFAEKALERQIENAKKQFFDLFFTGESKKVPFGIWTTPLYSGELIASREIVLGSYLGTDNRIQLADTVGFAVEGGVYIGTEGLPSKLFVSGQTKLFFTRTYTHLKPINSMKRALKEPWTNIMVPLLKREYGSIFDELATGEFDNIPDPVDKESTEIYKEKQEKLNEIIKIFSENMSKGESIIIANKVGGGATINAGYSLADRIKLQGSLGANQIVLSRLHILRKDEHTIQVYNDLGNVFNFQISLGLKAQIPIVNIGLRHTRGTAKTEFFTLNINPHMDANKDIVSNLLTLRQMFMSNSLELLKDNHKPYTFKHKIKESAGSLSFLHWRWLKLKSLDMFSVTTPNGVEGKYITRACGKRSGKSYQDLALDIFNSLIEEFTDSEIVLASTSSGNPGDTIFGESVTRHASFESKLIPRTESQSDFEEAFYSTTYRWKGWEISVDGVLEILDEIKDRYNYVFYDPKVLNETKSLQLYSIDLNIYIYAAGIEHMAQVTKNRVKEIFNTYANFPKAPNFHIFDSYANEEDMARRQKIIDTETVQAFLHYQNFYNQALAAGNPKEGTKWGEKMLSMAESLLQLEGLVLLVGGSDNLYIQSRIQGFREGDEAGDKAIISNHIGKFGSIKRNGPLKHLQRQLGMTESEFYIYWIMEKIL